MKSSKTKLRRCLLLANLLMVSASGEDFLESVEASEAFSKIQEQFSNRYLPGVGLALLDFSESSRGRLFDECDLCTFASELLVNSDTLGWFTRPYDLNSNHLLEDGSDSFQRSLFVVRLQDDLDSEVENASAGSFSYFSGDRSGIVAKGALLVDAFLPSDWLIGGYQTGENGFGLHFRTGIEVNHVSGSAGDEQIDHREYFVGLNILAPIIGDLGGLKSAKATEMDFSFRRTENGLTNEHSESLVLGWKPAFRKLFRRQISVSELQNPTSLLAEPQQAEPGTKSLKDRKPHTSSLTKLAGTDRFSLSPSFEVEQFVNNTVEGMEGTCLCAGIDLQLITLSDHVKLTYDLDYLYSLEGGDSYVFQEVALDILILSETLQDASFSLSYLSGRRAPDFKREELFTAGFGLQF